MLRGFKPHLPHMLINNSRFEHIISGIMNWKGFFKPDWRRLVVFFALNFLFLTSFWSAFTQPEIYDVFDGIFTPFGFLLHGMFNYNIHFIFSDMFVFTALSYILDLIYWYFLACLFVAVYDKLRGRNQ